MYILLSILYKATYFCPRFRSEYNVHFVCIIKKNNTLRWLHKRDTIIGGHSGIMQHTGEKRNYSSENTTIIKRCTRIAVYLASVSTTFVYGTSQAYSYLEIVIDS